MRRLLRGLLRQRRKYKKLTLLADFDQTFSCACSTASEARATYCLDELYHVILEMDHEAILTGFQYVEV